MILFHRTSEEAAPLILANGFRDCTRLYMMSIELTGVFVSDKPLDVNSGTEDGPLFRIHLDAAEVEIDEYELKEEGKPYREWCVPAALLNTRGRIEIVDESEL